jgi:hypothetical protein
MGAARWSKTATDRLRSQKELTRAVGFVLSTEDDAAWEAVLSIARTEAKAVDAETLAAALGARNARIRAAAARYVQALRAAPAWLSEAAASEVVAAEPEAAPPPQGPWSNTERLLRDDSARMRQPLDDFPEGFASGLADALRCGAQVGAKTVIVSTASEDSPRAASVLWSEASRACAEVARLLVVSSYPDGLRRNVEQDGLRLVQLSPAYLAWLDGGSRGLAVDMQGARASSEAMPLGSVEVQPVDAILGPSTDVWSLRAEHGRSSLPLLKAFAASRFERPGTQSDEAGPIHTRVYMPRHAAPQ